MAMSKIDFVKKAPIYYALAIASTMSRATAMLTRSDIDNDWDKQTLVMSHNAVWNAATQLLEADGVIEVVRDEFGPNLYRGTLNTSKWLHTTAPEQYDAAAKFKNSGRGWLRPALDEVNSRYYSLSMGDDDFNLVEESEWQPLPIDRNDERFQTAERAIDEAIQSIEGDNGYAVHAAEERSYVLSNLKAFKQYVSENTSIYIEQVNVFVVQPLGRAIARFGGAAVGLAASAAKQAVFDWIKANASKLLSLISG